MRAAVITGVGKVAIETVPDPTPGDRDVIVKVAAVGICGTDLHILQGEFAPTLPIIPGHEMSGKVVAIGSGVTEVKIGDLVAVDPSLHCGECFYCRRARGNLCENWNALGVSYPGAAAELLKTPVKNVHILPEGVDVFEAALIEPLSCAIRGYDVLPRIPGSHYLIYGSGTMGLMMAELAKRNGAASVSVVDINEAKLETAKILGIDHATSNVKTLNQPRGWDVVIDCTGVAKAIQEALSHVMPGGTFLQFGVANEKAKVEIEPFWIYNKEITIAGSMAVLHTFDRAVDLFASGVLNPKVMISDRFSLEDYEKALNTFKDGIGRKIIITPNGSSI